jgi:hypothetical protein
MMDTHQVVPLVHSAAMGSDLEAAIVKLIAYCRANDWAGYDPYDALNSPIFRSLPFLDCRLPRLVFTQALKRSPVNFRRLLHIPKTQNPKAIALFLSAFVTLERANAACQKGDIDLMIERLRNLRSPGTDYWCWGYSFPWQTRTIVVPSGAPNLVCTSFVANALLDASDRCRDSQCLNMALSAAEYILNELYWTEGGAAGFSYPLPLLRTQVHNANFLAAALLCRVYRCTNDEKFLLPALRVARYSVTKQHPDGSWHYGEAASQRWIDNFHTGYNLCALQAISRYAATTEFDAALRRGFEFYRSHFFREDGSVSYFHDRNYPIDIHCVAQSILTLLTLKEMDPSNLPLAHSVLRWAWTHLWDDRGFFYYRVLRSCTNQVSYMRWSQAWMLLAMATLLDASKCDDIDELDCRSVGIARSGA